MRVTFTDVRATDPHVSDKMSEGCTSRGFTSSNMEVAIKVNDDITHNNNNNNNNQAFYSQASWGRLEMKPYEQKNRYKIRAKKKGKTKAIKNQIKIEKRQ
jgi:hypothetical protein